MKVSGTSIAILVCALVLMSGVSAENVDNSAGYSVTPSGNLYLPVAASPMTTGYITQGQTDWYTVIVPEGTASITADVNWNDLSDSLSLTAIAPDGTAGPYYDVSDGVLNGRIFLTFSRTGGITPGTWKFGVYGESVLGGYQTYNFVTY